MTGRDVGLQVSLQVSLQVCLIAADGEAAEHPHHSRHGETRRAKARMQVATRHQQVRRQRGNVHHQTALALLRRDAVRALEDRRVAG